MTLINQIKDYIISNSSEAMWKALVGDAPDVLMQTLMHNDVSYVQAYLQKNAPTFSGLTIQTINNLDTEVTNTSDPETGLSLQQLSYVIPASSSYEFTNIEFIKTVSVTCDIRDEGVKINLAGVLDADNVARTSTEAQLINGIFTDLCYNDRTAGSTNLALPAIDLGSSESVGILRVYWWSDPAYLAQDYKIQSSDDGNTWTDVVTGLSSVGFADDYQDIVVNTTARYFRVFCVQGVNASYTVLSEMEAYSLSSTFTRRNAYNLDHVIIEYSTNGSLLITNNYPEDITFFISYISE